MAIPRVKITVIRKVDMRDLWGAENLGTVVDFPPVCPFYQVGDEFMVEQTELPAGFCVSAFHDIYRYIFSLRTGGNFSWMAKAGEAVVCCTDAFRPVVFRLERLDDSTSDSGPQNR